MTNEEKARAVELAAHDWVIEHLALIKAHVRLGKIISREHHVIHDIERAFIAGFAAGINHSIKELNAMPLMQPVTQEGPPDADL